MSVTQSVKRPLVVLTGPTAVGKTKLSIALAKAIGGEILSADSMQVYKHMDIGSAKIRPEEMQGVPHHLIDILEPWEEFNVVVFQKRCLECMEQIYDRGHIPILVGGTGSIFRRCFGVLILRRTKRTPNTGKKWNSLRKKRDRKYYMTCSEKLIRFQQRTFIQTISREPSVHWNIMN